MVELGELAAGPGPRLAAKRVLGNRGSGHALTHPFAVLGYHATGSEARLFLYGLVVGAIGMAALSLLLASARHTSRRGSVARRGLRQSRQETAAASRERDDLLDQREAARAYTASTLDADTPRSDPDPGPADSRWGRLPLLGHRPAPQQAADGPPESLTGQGAPDATADVPAP